MAFRTDLAVELLENLRESGKIEGVTETEYKREVFMCSSYYLSFFN